jgi:hypothetical protein
MPLEESLKKVSSLTVCPPFEATVSGNMHRDCVEVSDRVRSIAYFLNMSFAKILKGTLMNEFVWDPINIRFATVIGKGKFMKTYTGYSPHEALAKVLEADFNYVCGGIIHMDRVGDNKARSLKVIGTLTTSEFSGHFHQNWTEPIREQYKKYMHLRTGLTISHTAGMM